MHQGDQSIREFILQRETQATRSSFDDHLKTESRDQFDAGINQPELPKQLLTPSCTYQPVDVLCERFKDVSTTVQKEPKLFFNMWFTDIFNATIALNYKHRGTQYESSVTTPTEL